MAVLNYYKASQVLAYGKLFSKSAACNVYDVASGTYDGWKNKLKSDDKLLELYEKELTELREQWKEECISTLKSGLNSIKIAFDNHYFHKRPNNYKDKIAWAKGVTAASLAIKSIGDLTIGTVVLSEEDDED